MPLIGFSSELVDGLEPHDLNLPVRWSSHSPASQCGGEVVYPGWCRSGGYREGYTGYPVEPSFEAYLRYIKIKTVHTAV